MKNMIAKSLLTIVVLLAAFSAAPNAFALTSLKQVQVSSGGRVDLYFDGKVGRSQIKTEYFNDTIQFSLMDVSVYPAKISSISGGDIAKIFAYQYAPKLVRCRITVRGKAEAFRDRLKLEDRGKLLTIFLGDADGGSDTVLSGSAQAARPSVEIQAGKPPEIGPGEKSLLERIMKESPASAPVKVAEAPKSAVANAQAVAPAVETAPVLGSQTLGVQTSPLAGGKPLANPMRVMGKFAIVLALFGMVAMVLRKILRGEARIPTGKHGSFGAIRRFAANRLGKPAKMIEIVSTHHLGPKKSIVVANIAGRMLVLGISNESINLITQLAASEPQGEAEAQDDIAGGILTATLAENEGPSFSGILESEDVKPTPTATNGAVRNRIRSRLEGLKQL